MSNIDEVEVKVIWTPGKSWGNDAFLVEGEMYRKARSREKPTFTIETKYGDLHLKKMDRIDLLELDEESNRRKNYTKKRVGKKGK